MSERLRVLILAPGCDGTDVGESWSCFQWVLGLSRVCDVTLLTLQRPGRQLIAEQLPHVEVISWHDVHGSGKMERITSMLKPGYLRFYWKVRRWIRNAQKAGREFDLIHQVGPLALRYPSPGVGWGVPLVLGPLAGSLETPPGFVNECRRAPWYTSFRKFDRFRLRFDPWLRKTYSRADVVIGVAPYVSELLKSVPVRRFELAAETGVHHVEMWPRLRLGGEVRCLYVGRVIRTKGLRDAIRAMALIPDLAEVTLDAVGDGEDLDACEQLADVLQVKHRVRFHGRQSRTRVEQFYRESDVFLFPSFREPSGNVVFEALSHGLPVITTDRGGPAYVVNDESGIRSPAHTPDQLATDLANSIRRIVADPELRQRLSQGALVRAREIGLWQNKIQWMTELYQSVVENHRHEKTGSCAS
ncbi:MAG: glycosyltransferase family 4 protein [Planctomycetaceae bacterium]